jgi:hypothetical protein
VRLDEIDDREGVWLVESEHAGEPSSRR